MAGTACSKGWINEFIMGDDSKYEGHLNATSVNEYLMNNWNAVYRPGMPTSSALFSLR